LYFCGRGTPARLKCRHCHAALCSERCYKQHLRNTHPGGQKNPLAGCLGCLVLIVGGVAMWSCGGGTPRVADADKHGQAGAQPVREGEDARARAQGEEQAQARAEQEARARAKEWEQATRAAEEAKARQEALAYCFAQQGDHIT
jgi:hypothetical protein